MYTRHTITTALAAAVALPALNGCSAKLEPATPAATVTTKASAVVEQSEATAEECADEVHAHLTGREKPELDEITPDACLGMSADECADTLLAVTRDIDEGKRDR
ncbi:hypothetical protein JI76_18185 [Streptomyces anulatus]|uniref:hypothetical protein n=1 Tax=Streptomyces anulatus TaxID=1892 RepID=UPI0006DB5F67|nr:hypothetical protein [Streptomyces anulatus]KPL31130.1 hypothetical protein JI76_18185 [Streptomyces anulatus]